MIINADGVRFILIDPCVVSCYKDGKGYEIAFAVNFDYAEILSCLLYRTRTGDTFTPWKEFEDGAECNPNKVQEWMPEAIRLAICTLKVTHPHLIQFSEYYYLTWADEAEETLKAK